jgi:hypothetical protein
MRPMKTDWVEGNGAMRLMGLIGVPGIGRQFFKKCIKYPRGLSP